MEPWAHPISALLRSDDPLMAKGSFLLFLSCAAALSAATASAQSLKDLRAQERENQELARQAAFTSEVCGQTISAAIDWRSAADWPAGESLAAVCDGALGAVETICRRGRTGIINRFVCAGEGSGAELSGKTLRYGATPGENGYAATLAEIGAAE